MASDRDTLTDLIVRSGLNLDRGPYVETWPEDEREHHRRPDWPSFEHRAHAMQEYRREQLAASILAHGWRAPAREITTAAQADALPIGTILFHVDCPDPDPCIWRRACSPSEVEDEIDGGTFDHIHWAAWGDEDERYDGEDLEGHADCGGPLLAVYVPTEDPDCPHDSRSGAGGRWRCDQCGADCGPNTYLTPTEEKTDA